MNCKDSREPLVTDDNIYNVMLQIKKAQEHSKYKFIIEPKKKIYDSPNIFKFIRDKILNLFS